MPVQSLPLVTYHLLQNGIHELVPHESSAKSVQQIFQVLNMIYAATPSGQTVRYSLADHNNVGILPINHVGRLGREWLQKNPHHHPTRSLFMYHSNVLLTTGISVLSVIARSSRSQWKWRFFDIKDADKGMDWLLSDK
jgi:hypothetical protein